MPNHWAPDGFPEVFPELGGATQLDSLSDAFELEGLSGRWSPAFELGVLSRRAYRTLYMPESLAVRPGY